MHRPGCFQGSATCTASSSRRIFGPWCRKKPPAFTSVEHGPIGLALESLGVIVVYRGILEFDDLLPKLCVGDSAEHAEGEDLVRAKVLDVCLFVKLLQLCSEF